MIYSRIGKLFCIAVLALFIHSPAGAAAKFVEVIGETSQTLRPGESPNSPFEATFVLERLDDKKIKPVPEELVLGTQTFAVEEIKATIEAEKGKTIVRLNLTLPRTLVKRAGSYQLLLSVTKTGETKTEHLRITLVRQAAQLALPTTFRVQRTKFLPIPSLTWGSLEPPSLHLHETGGNSSMEFKRGPNKKIFAGLQADSTSAEVGRLTVKMPDNLAAGKGDDAALGLENDTPLGTLKGTLTIRSDQMAAPKQTVAVELVTRLASYWLLIVIAVSVLIGHLVRVVMENQRLRSEALATAWQAIARYNSASSEILDEQIRAQLDTTKDEFSHKIKDLSQSPRNIISKTKITSEIGDVETSAAAKLDKILKAFAEKRNKVAADIDTAEADLGMRPEIGVTELDAVFACIEDARQALEQGQVSAAEEVMADDLRTKLRSAVSGLKHWCDRFIETLNVEKQWPDIESDNYVEQVRQRIKNLSTALNGQTSAKLLGDALHDADELLKRSKPLLFEFRAAKIEQLVGKVRDALEQGLQKDNAATVSALNTAIAHFSNARAEKASTIETFSALMKSEEALHKAVGDFLKAGTETEETKSLIDEGKFLEATNKLRIEAGLDALGSPDESLAEARRSDHRDAELSISARSAWSVRVVGASELRVGESALLKAEISLADGHAMPSDMQVSWWVDGDIQPSSGRQGLNCAFRPRRAGWTRIQVQATSPADGVTRTAHSEVFILPSRAAEAAEDAAKRAKSIKFTQTAVAGVLIVAVGFAIFEDSFVGTLSNFFTAALWGFFADVGIAHLKTVSAAAHGKKLKVV